MPDGLGGEEWFEDLRQICRCDAASAIAHPHLNPLVDLRARPRPVAGVDGDADRALRVGVDGIDGVAQQVHPHLVELPGVRLDTRVVAVVTLDADPRTRQPVTEQPDRALDAFGNLGGYAITAVGAREDLQVVDDFLMRSEPSAQMRSSSGVSRIR